ncbi:class I SAM-dependent methyltransferase [Corallococcus sp. BB11-1]|uniref:class I SAM-dependent DNA methyltransferase n=1 Tax=Corallococcus sp. BB11-1 TaxID=2996783 RepID=UPI00226E770B|nr:class I SAM-dependent methyltransferase [Corallococcus sp. BB11-1]MCY1034621.1 class I SAM-dependent methyltransferase [Corallococcus sp. BB11-1]
MPASVFVDNIWNDFAHSYDEMIPQLPCYQRQLAKIVRDTRERPYVIDAGCGTGLVGLPLVQRGQRVVGFDNNAAMLRLAARRQEREPDAVRARWKLLPGDVSAFPPEVEGGADAVVMNNVLFYVRDPEAVLREAWTHLKPGGVLCMTSNKRPRPDLEKVLTNSIQEWRQEGRWDARLQNAVAHHRTCAQRLTTDPNEMVTFLDTDAAVRLLEKVGFSEALVADGDDYYGENFYVCMRK